MTAPGGDIVEGPGAPMFSVVIATHNRAQLLPRAIQSVLDQTSPDWELVVVDDGSTDETRRLVEGFRDARIRYFFQENAGAALARNAGAKQARGRYLVFLDSDDEVLPEALALFARSLAEPRVAIVFGAAVSVEEKDGSRTETLTRPRSYGELYGGKAVLFLAGTFALQKDLFTQVEGYRDKPSRQQQDLAIRVIPECEHRGLRVQSLRVPVARVYWHGGNRISHDIQAQYEGAKATLDDYGGLLSAKAPERYAVFCRTAGVNAFKLGKYREARRFFWRAVRRCPWQWKSPASFLLSLVPPIARLVWRTAQTVSPPR